MQHQLAERRRYGRGVGRQPQQPQGNWAAGLGTVFQRMVHQPLIGKGQCVLAGPGGRRGGRILAVPQFQQVDLVPLGPKAALPGGRPAVRWRWRGSLPGLTQIKYALLSIFQIFAAHLAPQFGRVYGGPG